ncbi:hypothetical protein J2X46_003069 [Nocardioides sp. BE266]|uniref:hypothetical protein n=1 Tax=Nocardioides sp. BE266 TaxID=2817725 RepID=UPI0028652685|nr:hypothetical protein [Nocardioides sp. BE266]MDR7254079.1 hypothetical protein [Nocardioides sp. BE266]
MLLAGLPDGGLARCQGLRGALGPADLGVTGQHHQQLPAHGRVAADPTAGSECDRDEVGVGAEPERADREPAAAVRLDRTVRQAGQVEDPHAPSAGGE